MDLINSFSILKKGTYYVILLLTLSCSDNKNHSQNELENLLYDFHIKNSQPKELENGIDLLITKKLNSEYTGLFYKIKNSDKFYVGFIYNDKNIIKVINLKGKETVSIFDNNQCFVFFDKNKKTIIPQGDDNCFTIFIGKIPYEGYSNIELEWNCSNKSVITEKLIEGKYFFFFKESLGDNICNIKLISNKGQTESISFDLEKGVFF